MTLFLATADLSGDSSVAAVGKMDLSLAMGLEGESLTVSEIEGAFVIQSGVSGDASAGTGLTKVSKLIGAAVTGEGSMGGAVSSTAGATMSGEASVTAATDLILGVSSALVGDASVVADADVALDAASAVVGDGSASAGVEVLFAAAVAVDGDADASATALADDEIAGDMTGQAATSATSKVLFGPTAIVVGEATVTASRGIVRPAIITAAKPEVTVAPGLRYIGLQPGRESPTVGETLRIVPASPEQIIQRNRQARRVITPIRRNTGVSVQTEDD